MRIEPPCTRDVAYVGAYMRQRDRDEFIALTHFASYGELVFSLIERFASHPDVFVVHDEEPVAVGGMILHRPNVATLLFFATDKFAAVGRPFTRFVKKQLFRTYVERGVHRIEAQALADYGEVRSWLNVLGLTAEATMPGFGRDGQTYIQYAWTKSVRSPRP